MTGFRQYKQFFTSLPATILWGCIGGISFAAVSFCLYTTSRVLPISCYFDILRSVHTPWIFGTAIILSLTLGMIAADLFRTSMKTGPDLILTGSLSGICTALVGYMLVDSFHLLGFTWIWPNGPLDVIRRAFGGNDLAIYIIILAFPQILGAWYQGSRQKCGSDKNDSTPQGIIGIRYRPWFFFASLLVVLLIIPLGLYVLPVDENQYCAGGNTCQPGEQCGTGNRPDNVTVSRTSPDTIRFSLKASSTCGSYNAFRILLNGIDVSNQKLIAKSGLNVTITPSDGLGKQDGSYVILQGKDVATSESSPPRIQVMIIVPGGNTMGTHRDLYL